jgi:hypothetical protein
LSLNLVGNAGSKAHREKAMAVLDELTRSEDSYIASGAAWSRDTKPDKEYIAEFLDVSLSSKIK